MAVRSREWVGSDGRAASDASTAAPGDDQGRRRRAAALRAVEAHSPEAADRAVDDAVVASSRDGRLAGRCRTSRDAAGSAEETHRAEASASQPGEAHRLLDDLKSKELGILME